MRPKGLEVHLIYDMQGILDCPRCKSKHHLEFSTLNVKIDDGKWASVPTHKAICKKTLQEVNLIQYSPFCMGGAVKPTRIIF